MQIQISLIVTNLRIFVDELAQVVPNLSPSVSVASISLEDAANQEEEETAGGGMQLVVPPPPVVAPISPKPTPQHEKVPPTTEWRPWKYDFLLSTS